MSKKPKRRHWSEEEEYFLQDKWGEMSIKAIAKRLNRTIYAVKVKANRMGLQDPRLSFEGITLSQLSKAVGVPYSVLRNWIKLYDFPVRRRTFAIKHRIMIVHYDDFWEWAKKNKHMIDFSRMEKNILGAEPEWVEVKRKADKLSRQRKPQPHNTPWSDDDITKLKWMLKQHKYTYPEISKELGRSHGAIKRRILDLGIKERPVPLNNHNKYTQEEEKKIVKLMKKGYCFEVIAEKLGENRSAAGVRGKVERMGYKFRNGVPYLEEVN